ncbi:MAG: hypothetical protein KJ587_20070 [Alphaproteobacteria bacterium]|nr:hypothetical protein [Alphaproteobacteria bacterium]
MQKPNNIQIEMLDNSKFKIENKYWLKALNMKLKNENLTLEEFNEIIKIETEKHWRNKTTLTKFGTASWESNLKQKFYMEKYDKFWKEEHKKQVKYYKKLGVDYDKVSSTCWEKNIEKPVRHFKDYKIINKDLAIADSDLKDGQIQLIIKIKGSVDKFDNKIMEEGIKKQQKYAENKFKKFKGKIYKNQSELAEEILYSYIRGYLMGIIFSKETKGKGETILLGRNNVTKISKDSIIQMEEK